MKLSRVARTPGTNLYFSSPGPIHRTVWEPGAICVLPASQTTWEFSPAFLTSLNRSWLYKWNNRIITLSLELQHIYNGRLLFVSIQNNLLHFLIICTSYEMHLNLHRKLETENVCSWNLSVTSSKLLSWILCTFTTNMQVSMMWLICLILPWNHFNITVKFNIFSKFSGKR